MPSDRFTGCRGVPLSKAYQQVRCPVRRKHKGSSEGRTGEMLHRMLHKTGGCQQSAQEQFEIDTSCKYCARNPCGTSEESLVFLA